MFARLMTACARFASFQHPSANAWTRSQRATCGDVTSSTAATTAPANGIAAPSATKKDAKLALVLRSAVIDASRCTDE